jgi:hypothetical protein
MGLEWIELNQSRLDSTFKPILLSIGEQPILNLISFLFKKKTLIFYEFIYFCKKKRKIVKIDNKFNTIIIKQASESKQFFVNFQQSDTFIFYFPIRHFFLFEANTERKNEKNALDCVSNR